MAASVLLRQLRPTPMTPDEYLSQYTKPGVMLTRKLSGYRSRSYIGGLPSLPGFLRWPSSEGSGRALSFLCQIDLAELPGFAGRSLPDDGVLFFFAGRTERGDELEHRVLYAPVSSQVPFDEAPAPPARPGLGSGNWLPPPFSWDDEWSDLYHVNPRFPPEVPLDRLPRFDFGMTVVDTVRPVWETEFEDELDAQARALVHTAAWTCNDRTARESPSLWLLETALPFPADADPHRWCSSPNEWPWSWRAVELIVRREFREHHSTLLTNLAKGDVKRQLEDEALAWLQLALEAGETPRMPAPEAERFTRWLVGAAHACWSGERASIDTIAAGRRRDFVSRFRPRFESASQIAAAFLLAEPPQRRRLPPEPFLEACLPWVEQQRNHQVLGYPRWTQHPPKGHYDDELLLQLCSDIGARLLFNDCDAIQFSLSKQDLAERRFDRTRCFITS